MVCGKGKARLTGICLGLGVGAVKPMSHVLVLQASYQVPYCCTVLAEHCPGARQQRSVGLESSPSPNVSSVQEELEEISAKLNNLDKQRDGM